jgi:hypothetical protein
MLLEAVVTSFFELKRNFVFVDGRLAEVRM